MMQSLATKTIDNLQVTINALHLRLESNNPAFSNDHFSMGFTMQKLSLHTTDSEWSMKFIDRTEAPLTKLFKMLQITDFGFYYRPNETTFVSATLGENSRLQ
jgi:hypothetical protein